RVRGAGRRHRKNAHDKKAPFTGRSSLSHHTCRCQVLFYRQKESCTGLAEEGKPFYNRDTADRRERWRTGMRVMALDYGDVRTGVAVSDAGGMLVGYTAVLQGRDRAQVAEQAARLARERGVEAIVVGLPRNMDGTEGAR